LRVMAIACRYVSSEHYHERWKTQYLCRSATFHYLQRTPDTADTAAGALKEVNTLAGGGHRLPLYVTGHCCRVVEGEHRSPGGTATDTGFCRHWLPPVTNLNLLLLFTTVAARDYCRHCCRGSG
jgi:hypothetical protein